MSTKLVIYNTLSYYTAYGLLFFSCKRLHFELGIVTTTTNGYHAPLISLSSTLQHDSLWFKIIYFQSPPTHSNESIKPWDGVYQRLKLCVSHTWNSVFHGLETVRFKAWNDEFRRLKLKQTIYTTNEKDYHWKGKISLYDIQIAYFNVFLDHKQLIKV